MVDAISTALSGMNAQKVRLQASASNIANISTAGGVPGSITAPAAAPAVYKPLTATLTSQEDGGVIASLVEKENAYSTVSDPSSPYADANGNIAVPNVDLAEEAVNLVETKAAFKANAAVLRAQEEMSEELLKTTK